VTAASGAAHRLHKLVRATVLVSEHVRLMICLRKGRLRELELEDIGCLGWKCSCAQVQRLASMVPSEGNPSLP
jgi:hypothetical protein